MDQLLDFSGQVALVTGGSRGLGKAMALALAERGADLIGTPLASFAQVIAASDQVEVFNGYCGAESGWVPVSAASPELLVRRIEIQRKESGDERAPILPPPGADADGGAP